MDADDTKEEILHNRALIKKYREQLKVLELQKAGFGDLYVPPYIQIEIDKLNENMQKCKQEIDTHKRNFIDLARTIIDKSNKTLQSENIVDYKITWRQYLVWTMYGVHYTKQGVEDLFIKGWGFTPQELNSIGLPGSVPGLYSNRFIVKYLIKIILRLKRQLAEIENL